MFTHMHYRVLGVGSLRIQGPVEREYLNNSGQAGQSVNAIDPRGRPKPRHLGYRPCPMK